MRTRLKHAIVAGATIALVAPLGVALVAQGASAAPVLLSAGKPATASSSNQTYVAGNVTDGNQASYWESANNAFPQWVQVDLGAAATVTDVTLKIPGGWGARNETVTLQGSTDGSSFTTLKASASYAFTGGNTVAVDVTDTSARYVRAAVSANTGWPAAQLSEVEVYGNSSTPPVDPPEGSNLAQGRPITATSVQQTYVAGNAVDGSTATYWEGAPGAYPSNLTVSLAAQSTLTGVVVKLNPDAAWGNRTQTFAVEGRTGSGSWSTLKASAAYAFSPSSGNTVTVPVSRVRDGRPARVHREHRLLQRPGGRAAGVRQHHAGADEPRPPGRADDEPDHGDADAGDLRRRHGPELRDRRLGRHDGRRRDRWHERRHGERPGARGRCADHDHRERGHPGHRHLPAHGHGRPGEHRRRVERDQQRGQSGSVVVSSGPEPTTADLQVSLTGTSPASPTPTDVITVTGTARNTGTAGSAATTVALTLNGTAVGTANVGALAAGAQQNVSVSIGTRAAGTYALVATVDPTNTVAESNESNNTATASLVVTAPPTGDGSDLAAGRPATASSTEFSFVAGNAVDADPNTYWEGAGGAYPSWLAVNLASQSTLQQVVVGVPPVAAWGARTQTFSIEGRVGTGAWTSLKASAAYAFAPGSGNNGDHPGHRRPRRRAAALHRQHRRPGGQVAELEVCGTPAPNPDLVVTAVTLDARRRPNETTAITLSATVRNAGTAAAGGDHGQLQRSAGRVVGTVAGRRARRRRIGHGHGQRRHPARWAATPCRRGRRPGQHGRRAERRPTTRFTAAVAAGRRARRPARTCRSSSITSNPAEPGGRRGGHLHRGGEQPRHRRPPARPSVTRVDGRQHHAQHQHRVDRRRRDRQRGRSPARWTATSGGATITATADATNVVAETNETNNSLVAVDRGRPRRGRAVHVVRGRGRPPTRARC